MQQSLKLPMLTRDGLKGGRTFFSTSSVQLIEEKNGWDSNSAYGKKHGKNDGYYTNIAHVGFICGELITPVQ